MNQQRHSGYVVGNTVTDHGVYWTVRVKDPSSSHNGRKLKVVPQESTTLVAGLNVNFLIGTFGPEGKAIEKAFDIKTA